MCKSSNLLGSDEKTGQVNIHSKFEYFVLRKLCSCIKIANNEFQYHIPEIKMSLFQNSPEISSKSNV